VTASLAPPASRKGYLDWLRGAAVILMIHGHSVDSWTRPDEKTSTLYGLIMLAWGIAAPLFLFLAGVSLSLAGGRRLRNGRTDAEAAALARKRAWQIFGLAFLFRLQAWVISGGDAYSTLLKVDILNVMGLAMLGGALLWGLGRGRVSRALVLVAGTAAVAMVTPIVRGAPWLSSLPDAVEAYLRPLPGMTTFTLLPWAAFLLAGAACGLWLDWGRDDRHERRVNIYLALLGAAVAGGGYAASFLPPIYDQTNFWTSSPTFFFLRAGIVIAFVPIAYALNLASRVGLVRAAVQEFGRSSLFVYWIHVEMAYGVLSAPLHRRLTLEQSTVGFLLLTMLVYGLVRLKQQLKGDEIRHLRDHRAVQHLARALVPSLVVDQEKVAQRPVNDVKPQV
jgi:uncharacterized membrane protein